MIIHIRIGFDRERMSERMSESVSKSVSESMSELEISRMQVVIKYLDTNGEINGAEAAKLLGVELKAASRLLSKAEKVKVLESHSKTKDKVYMRKQL